MREGRQVASIPSERGTLRSERGLSPIWLIRSNGTPVSSETMRNSPPECFDSPYSEETKRRSHGMPHLERIPSRTVRGRYMSETTATRDPSNERSFRMPTTSGSGIAIAVSASISTSRRSSKPSSR